MKKLALLFALVAMVSGAATVARADGMRGGAGNLMPGGPSFWGHNPRSMGVVDYLSQTNECQMFYSRTAQLRKDYREMLRHRDEWTAAELAALTHEIQSRQPIRFSCPW
jgi:hypothetical protein